MDDLLIAPWERLSSSRAEMARAEGVSIRTIQRRLKEERERVGRRRLDVAEIVSAPGESKYEYRLDDDVRSRLPSGLFLIGDHHGRRLNVHYAGDGRPIVEPKKSKAKFKPKRPRKSKSPAKAG